MSKAKSGPSAITHGFMQRKQPELERLDRLTTEEAKAALAAKGWTNRALADWWGFREEYISKIINNPGRKRHFDDALRGLPHAVEVGLRGS